MQPTAKKMALHNNYQIRWKNFKGFVDTEWKTIKPITILIGANNAGKTNFIAPLLLMNQTISSREDSKSPLVTNGRLYNGGNHMDLINGYDSEKELFLGFRYHTHSLSNNKLEGIGVYPPGAFEIIIAKSKKTDETEFFVKKHVIYDMFLREVCAFNNVSGHGNKFSIATPLLTQPEINDLKNITPQNFLFTPNTILSAKYPPPKTAAASDKASKKIKTSKGFDSILRLVSVNFSVAKNVILDLSYIGPLRDIPHRFYEISDEEHYTVGIKGENTPSLLKKNLKVIEAPLNEWIQKFGFGDKLILKQLSKEAQLYSIGFKTSKSKFTNIANSGFGASQILPLIVQSLINTKGSITIAEQPEIHLNPRLQGLLAELFVDMALKDQRVIVETHSEHLLLRLRTLVAENKISPDLIAVYYVHKEDGESKIREIPIDTNGRINSSEWPVGFFDDTLRNSLALAAAQAKKRE